MAHVYRRPYFKHRKTIVIVTFESTATKTVSDAGSGSDAVAQLLASIAVADTGAGAETKPSGVGGVEALIPIGDVGQGADAIGAISATLSIAEVASGADTITVGTGLVANIWTETQKARGTWTETQKGKGIWTETQKNRGDWTEE